MKEGLIIQAVYKKDGSLLAALTYTGQKNCDGCIFLDECRGDGDGTSVEGLGCPSGYVWK